MSENYKSKRSSKNGRSKRSSARNDRRDNYNDRDDRQFESKSKKGRGCGNDPSWYTVPGQLTKDVASLSFNNAAGVAYQMDPTDNQSMKVTPGIMSIYMGMCFGLGNSASSALNVAAKNIYSYVRHANSGHSNYDSPDLMMYILAMDSAFAYYAWMARLYGTMRVYDQRNRYLGQRLVAASGVDHNTLELASFRAYINQYAVKLGAFNVPASMSLYKRHTWMFNTVYADEDDMKAQFYMYQPAYVYIYDDQAGKLTAQPCVLMPSTVAVESPTTWALRDNSHLLTFSQIKSLGDLIIEKLSGSEDINIMSGDILKAYGSDVYRLSLIDENYAIIPTFSEEVLSQIHNTTFLGRKYYNGIINSTSVADVFAVNQSGTVGYGYLDFHLTAYAGYGGSCSLNKYLDFWHADPSPDDVMVATRNMVFTSHDEAYSNYRVETCGTEIPMFASVMVNSATNPTEAIVTSVGDFDATPETVEAWQATLSAENKMQVFNEHPILCKGSYDANDHNKFHVDLDSYRGELSNFTIVNFEDVRKMHDTALLSMLAVPLLGNVARA